MYDLQKYSTWEYKQSDYGSKRDEYIPQEYKDFRARMAKHGFDLDKIENGLKPGEKRSMEFKGKNGRIYRYVAEKMSEKNGDYMTVNVERKWRADPDGWEKMDMVPGGQNSPNSKVSFTDSWNLLGFTRVARRKLTAEEQKMAPNGAVYVYKVEETFDFAGSRSSSGDPYGRYTDAFTAKAIKKMFPSVVSLRSNGSGMVTVLVNQQWLEKVGKPFKLDIPPVYVNKFGQVIGEVKEAKPSETKKPLAMGH
jgi:beta-xylosidase